MTHITNKDSIEAPRLQPLYFRGHTEQLCPEPILQGLVSTGTGQLSLQETELESVQTGNHDTNIFRLVGDVLRHHYNVKLGATSLWIWSIKSENRHTCRGDGLWPVPGRTRRNPNDL